MFGGLFDTLFFIIITMKCAIKKDRKLNKNNTSVVRGIHFDKERGLWVAQMMFQGRCTC